MPKKNQNTVKSGKKRSFIILLILLLVVGVCALGGYTFLELRKLKSQVTHNTPASSAPAESPAPIYFPLETFTVSLKPENENDDHVLYIGLTLRVQNAASKALLDKFLPEIRSRLLILFSRQVASGLATGEGKAQLINQIKETVSEPLTGQQRVLVTDVLFNAFILR